MRVRVNSLYRYNPCLIDRIDGRTGLSEGDIVRVINVYGYPKANVMRHCYVGNPFTSKFIGMVCTGSLEPVSKSTKAYVSKRVVR